MPLANLREESQRQGIIRRREMKKNRDSLENSHGNTAIGAT